MLKKVSYTEEKHEWIIEAGGHEIPLAVISGFFRPLLILAILFFAYQIGQADVIVKDCNAKITAANNEVLKCKQGFGIGATPGFNITNYSGYANP